MPSDPKRVREIFDAAAELTSPAERTAFLDQACQGEPELRQHVVALLRQTPRADEFFETAALQRPGREEVDPTPEVAPTKCPLLEGPGTVIGHYKLLEKIGEGGFGVVYMAEQSEPIRRRVALKIIKLGMDTKNVVARFEAERQALALMDHPNIAKVLDGGATGTGRPYFVMELVRGTKITDYCDQNDLSTAERLALFTQVCHAIQHAHQKGIIHRDIKPSNILVTLHDGVPVPRIIDFGIAKATQQRLTEKTLFTAFEQFIGTPAYMSPEQAELNGLDIDTRSDIYSLGVLLYELLTGTTPFDGKELLAAGMDEMRRIIREKEPVRPSTRLSTMLEGERLTTARHRQVEVPKLIHAVRGDLDWIVMKALEKNRARRYETANTLALDIERHLNNEPVIARPPSTAYQLQKFIHRNKLMVTAAALVVTVLVLGVLVSTWQAIRATRAEREQRRLRDAAQKAEEKEAHLRQQAQTQELAARQRAYAYDMKATQVALQQNNLRMAVSLLQRYLPKPGELDLRGLEWRYLWQESQGDQQGSFPQPAGVYTATLSPDERYLATASEDRKIRVWDWATTNLIKEFLIGPDHANLFKAVQFSPEGKWLAAAGTSSVEIRATSDWHRVSELEPATPPICFSPDGQFLATGASPTATNRLRLRIWECTNWSQRCLTNARANSSALAFSPDGTRIACGMISNTANNALWDLRSEQGKPLTVAALSLAISADGKWLAAGNEAGQVHCWDLAGQQLVGSHQAHRGAVYGLAFSPDSRCLISGGVDQVIHLWEAGTTNRLRTLRGHLNEIWSLGFSRDGQRILSGSKDATVKLWNVSAGLPRGRQVALPADKLPVSFLPDGSALFIDVRGLDYGRYQLLSMPDGQLLRDYNALPYIGQKGWVHWYPFPENGIVFGWGTNKTIEMASLLTDAPVYSAPVSEPRTYARGLSRDNRWLFGMQPDHLGVLIDLRAARRVQGFSDCSGCAAFSPDNHWFAYATTNRTVRLWDVAANRAKGILRGPHWNLKALRFSPDGHLLAGGDANGEVWLWSVESAEPLHEFSLKGHQTGVVGVLFSADSKTLITGANDRTMRWWSVVTGQETLLFPDAQPIAVNPFELRAAWYPAGELVAWFERQKTVRFTPLLTLAEIDTIERSRRQPR